MDGTFAEDSHGTVKRDAEESAAAILSRIADLLEDGGEDIVARRVRASLSSSGESFETFLLSNELWGGAGSIADQSLISDAIRRRCLEASLAQLGKLQLAAGRANPRTAMWVEAFDRGCL